LGQSCRNLLTAIFLGNCCVGSSLGTLAAAPLGLKTQCTGNIIGNIVKNYLILVSILSVFSSCAVPARHPSKSLAHYRDQGWSERSASAALRPATIRPAKRGAFALPDDGENFVGTHRAVAKTTPVASTARTLSLAALLAGLHDENQPVSDTNMRKNHHPRMKKDWDFDRVLEERKNVTVEGWIVAVGKEADNDFHLIMASDPGVAIEHNPDCDKLINIEISALPPDGTRERDILVKQRNKFKGYFIPPVPDSVQKDYTMLDPVHVRVSGSLFFDVDHVAGAVGPGPLKPSTSWEIHPVTRIEPLD